MAFVPAWRPSAAAACWPPGAPAAASVSRPDRRAPARASGQQAMAGLMRLPRRADFLRVAGVRRKFVTPGLILQAARQSGNPAAGGVEGDQDRAAPSRVGFTATRKIGIAVARNRARRRLRAAADQVLPLHAAAGHDYVLVARAESLTRPFAALVEDLETALRRLGAWRDGAPGGSGEDRSGRQG